ETMLKADESRVPLLVDSKEDVQVLVDVVTPTSYLSEERGNKCSCSFKVGNLFGFLFSRVTYYWVALIAQFCQSVLLILGYALAVSVHEEEEASSVFTRSQALILCSMYNVMLLGFISYLIVCHYFKGAEMGGKTRMTAGRHHQLARSCAWLNIFCYIILHPSIPKMMAGSDSQTSTLAEDVFPIITPLIIGFQVVGVLACTCFSRSSLLLCCVPVER
ncbi:hypothetical protein CPC08DRAFT_705977, partial [Agrocybe pediades]